MTAAGPPQECDRFSQRVLERFSGLTLPPVHPRVYFDPTALQALRRQAGLGSAAWESIRQDAEELAAATLQGARPRIRENEPDGGALSLAFAFAVWQEPTFREAALRLIQPPLHGPGWVAQFHQGLRLDLRASVLGSSLALACDLLGPDLPDDTRRAVDAAVEQRVLGPFAEIWAGKLEWWTTRRMNWQAVIGSHVGLTLLATGDGSPAWRARFVQVLRAVLDFLDHCPPDGSFPEGLTYWHYGVGELAWFALGLRTISAGEIDLFQHPYLRATQALPLYLSTPDGCFDFEDSFDYRMDSWLIALLAREGRNPLLQGLVSPFSHQIRPPRKIDAPARGMRHVLCHDPELPAENRQSLPPSRYFPDTDTVALRSDWSADATFVALRGGSNGVPHGHLDAGSFIVGAFQRKLLPDAGFWRYTHGFFDYQGRRWDFDGPSTLGHNLLLVDEVGQGAEAGCRARIQRADLAGQAGDPVDWVVCDVTDAYQGRLLRFVRYLALIRPRTVVVVDEVLCDRPRRLRWLLQYRGDLSLGPSSLLVAQPGAQALVNFPLLPGTSPYRLSREVRHTHYIPKVDVGRPQSVQFASLSPLDPTSRWLVAAVIQLGDGTQAPMPVRALEASPETLRLELGDPQGRRWRGCFDLRARSLDWAFEAASAQRPMSGSSANGTIATG